MWEKFFNSWKESVSYLYPKPLALMLGLSFWSLVDLYIALFSAWFLPIALLVGLVLNIPSLLYSFYITLLARATRPSIELKNQTYWQRFEVADWVLYFTLVILLQVLYRLPHTNSYWYTSAIYSGLLRLFFLEGPPWLPGTESLGVLPIFLSPFVICWVFFMLDSRLTVWEYIKSFFRAGGMMIYNYPYFLAVYGVARLFLSGIHFISSPFIGSYPQLATIGWLLLVLVFLPYYVCVISNFYIKRIHEQFLVYYRG